MISVHAVDQQYYYETNPTKPTETELKQIGYIYGLDKCSCVGCLACFCIAHERCVSLDNECVLLKVQVGRRHVQMLVHALAEFVAGCLHATHTGGR